MSMSSKSLKKESKSSQTPNMASDSKVIYTNQAFELFAL